MTTKPAVVHASDAHRSSQIPGPEQERLPARPTAVKDAKATRELLFTLRHFHLGDPGASDRLEQVGNDFLPVLLDPFRDTSRLRYDYPLFLFPPADGDGHQRADGLVLRLADWLEQSVRAFAPGDDAARILKDHLSWIEYQIRQQLKGIEGPVLAAPILGAAGLALQRHLKLRDADQARLAADLDQLQDQLQLQAEHGELMGYGRFPALHLLLHAIRSRVVPRRERLRAQIDASIHGLESLLSVEWGKSDESIEPRQARDSVGLGGGLFDPDALSTVMDHSRGTRAMSPRQRQRIEGALAVLKAWHAGPVLARFVHLGSVAGDWLTDSKDVVDIVDPDPCACASRLFEQEAAKLAALFGALRIARLEIDGIYDPSLHDPWFANFGWDGFSAEELSLVPAVIALEDADRVASDDLRSFSQLLSSGCPVQVLVRVMPAYDPGAGSGTDRATDIGTGSESDAHPDPFQRYRTELGYLGLSHRQAAVSQTSAARHEHLMQSFLGALDATCTSLHLINTGLRAEHDLVPLNAWLVAGAAIEGRAHPFFRVDPSPEDCEPPILDFSGNPQPELDWPLHPFRYLDDNGNQVSEELAFTFADYCLLVQALRGHFRLIPPGCDSAALIPMHAYLSMPQDDAYRKVPFLWAVDGNGILQRLVVSRRLSGACLDRLNFWRTLQATAGVRNRHVDQAVERTRDEERQLAQAERERLLSAHATELEQVRNQAAGEAMQRLTDILLGMDIAGGVAGNASPLGLAAAQPAASTVALASDTEDADSDATSDAEADAKAVAGDGAEADDLLVFDEPWIDTPLCTSCNDCLRINPRLFIYNEEKQVLLGDLATATFAQLVEAAELCPAKCIHPGRPWNSDELELDALVERAAPFNQ
ncbi:MAG: ferredoxin [Thiohalocapsa sp.]